MIRKITLRRAALTAGAVTASLAFGAGSAEAYNNPLVGLWPLDEGSGQNVRDWSGKGNNGTLGATTAAEDADPSWIDLSSRYYKRSALRFNGTDYVRVKRSASLEPANISVGAIVRATGTAGNYRYIVSKGALQCKTASYGLFTGATGGLQFYMSNGVDSVLSADAGPQLWDGKWHIVLGTFDGSQVRLFVDGDEIGTGTPASIAMGYGLADDNNLYIGDYRGSCANPTGFTGDIDAVAVANKAFAWNG